jgi:hypothetical protein
MRTTILLTVLPLIWSIPSANAKDITKTTASGVPALMYSYSAWKNDCSPDLGVVKVLVKPQHGKLAPRESLVTIKGLGRRYNNGSLACVGKSTPAFKVYYTPARGFRGTDNFKIEVTYRGHSPDVDTFTVEVQ